MRYKEIDGLLNELGNERNFEIKLFFIVAVVFIVFDIIIFANYGFIFNDKGANGVLSDSYTYFGLL